MWLYVTTRLMVHVALWVDDPHGVSLRSKPFSLETNCYKQIAFDLWKLCSGSCNFNFISIEFET